MKNSVAGLANIGSELTKLTNSFIAFKSEITQKMIYLENSVDFCSKSYDNMKRANEIAVTRITQLEQQNNNNNNNKTNDLILNLTPENVTQHSRIE